MKIELLDKKRHDRATFSCGVPALNAYLQRQAAQDMEKHAAVVYVALRPPLRRLARLWGARPGSADVD